MMPKNQSLALLVLGSSWRRGWPQNSIQMSGGNRKKFQVTYLTMPNNFSYINDAQKSVPGIADVGVPHGDGDGPRTPPRCLEGSGKIFKRLLLLCLTIYLLWNMLLNQSLALLMLGSPMGMDGDGPVTLALGCESKKCAYHVDQHEKLKELNV